MNVLLIDNHTLIDNKPDVNVIQVDTNDILNHANHEDIARTITNIGLDWKNNGINEVFVSSILVKKNPNLTVIVRRVNDMLRDLCEKNGSSIICNDVITTDYLWKDGVHLLDIGTYILSNFFSKFLNNSIDSKFDNCLWLNDSPQTNHVNSDINGLIDLHKHFPYNPLMGYININTLKEKVIPLRDVLSNAPIDVLWVDEAKLDSNFLDHQFKFEGYQTRPFRRERNSKGGGKLVYNGSVL